MADTGLIPIAQAGQYCQIGEETTFGTEVNATIQLASVNITDGMDIESNVFKGTGSKLDTVVTFGKEMGDLAFAGPATYEEVNYFIRSLEKAAATDIPSYTVEKGVPGSTGMIYTGAVVTDWNLKGDTSKVDISGNYKTKGFTAGTVTSALAQEEQTPIENTHVTIKVAGAEITNLLSWDIKVSNLWAMANFVGDKNAVGANEGDISGEVTLVLEATSTNITRVDTRDELAFEFAFTNGVSAFNIQFKGRFYKADKFSAVGEIYAVGLTYRMTNSLIDATKVILVA